MIPNGLQSGHPGSVSSPLLQQAHSPRASNSPHPTPTNQDIEAVIQMATSGRGGPVPTRDTRTQLFVGNLPYRVRWQDLKDLFRKAGTVLRADVSLGPDNRSRGYGTVLLGSAEDAGRAIDMFNGYSWQTRILEVRPDRLPPEYDLNYPLPVAYGPPGVYPILPPQMQYPQSAFSMTNMMEDLLASSSSTSTGTPGLVQPGLTSSLTDPLRSSSRAGIHAVSTSGLGRSLYVGNLPFQCQWQDLKDLFRQIGPVARADIALGPDGRSRGFGTIVFQNGVDADKAVQLLNGYEYSGRQLKVHYDRPIELEQGPNASFLSSSPVLHHQHSSFIGVNPYSTHKPLIPSHIHQQQAAMYPFHSQPTSPFGEFPPPLPQHLFENPLKSSYIPGQTLPPPSSTGLRKPSSSQDLVSALAGSAIARSESALSSSGASTSDSVFSKMEFPSLHHRPPSSNSGKPRPTIDSPSRDNATSGPSSPERPTAQRNPPSNHPGSIAIPPPPSGFTANGVMFSPLSRGLPPMTPSMPGFSFHPQVSTPPGVHPNYLPQGGPATPHYYRHGSFQGMTMMAGMYSVPLTPPVPGQQAHPMLTPGPRLAGPSPMTSYPPQPMSPNHFPPYAWPGPGMEYSPHPLAMATPVARSAAGATSPGEYFPLTMAAVEEPRDYFPVVADPSSAPNSEAGTATSTTAADIDSPGGETSSTVDHPILPVPLVKAFSDSTTVDIVNEIAVASGTARGKPAAKLWMSQKERIKKPVLGQSASEEVPAHLRTIDVAKSNSAPGLTALPSPGGRRASWGETSSRKPAALADTDSR